MNIEKNLHQKEKNHQHTKNRTSISNVEKIKYFTSKSEKQNLKNNRHSNRHIREMERHQVGKNYTSKQLMIRYK